MICCKIIADFFSPDAKINILFDELSKHGEFLWENGSLFFADVVGDTSEKKINSYAKKAGFKKIFIQEYDQKCEPRESDNINGWIFDKIIKLNYNKCEQESQKVFRDISKGLDLLDAEIEHIKSQKENSKDQKDKED